MFPQEESDEEVATQSIDNQEANLGPWAIQDPSFVKMFDKCKLYEYEDAAPAIFLLTSSLNCSLKYTSAAAGAARAARANKSFMVRRAYWFGMQAEK